MTAALFMSGIGLLFGMSFGYFTGGKSWLWTILGAVIGALLGNFFGKAIDRSSASKK